MHPRIMIRNKFVELLNGNTDCGEKVYKNRARPFINVGGWVSELPAMVVYTNDETSQLFTAAPVCFERRAIISVEVHAGAGEDTDDFLDHVADQVEVLISRFDWQTIGVELSLSGTQMAIRDVGESQITGACAISFEMTYYSYLPDAAKADGLDDFITAANTYRIGTAENNQTVTLHE